jgi:hypothetical protein
MNGAKLNGKLLKEARSACEHYVSEQINTTPEIQTRERKKLLAQTKVCEQILEKWFTIHLPNINPVGVEERLYAIINGIPVIVIIDLDDNGIIKDFKLSRRAKSEKDALNSLQLSFYAAIKNASRAGFISCPFPDLSKKKIKTDIKEVIVQKNSGDRQWAIEVVGSVFKSIVLSTRENHFYLCDPASWKCSETYCDWWPICRGKVQGSMAERSPNWLKPKH